MCYCTYVYLGYSKTASDTSLMENVLYIAQNLLFKAESLSYEINTKAILMIQVKNHGDISKHSRIYIPNRNF